jgi:hypothetical protein
MKQLSKFHTIIIIMLQISSFSFSMRPAMRLAFRTKNQTRFYQKIPVRFHSTKPTRSDRAADAIGGFAFGTIGLGLGAAGGNLIGGICGSLSTNDPGLLARMGARERGEKDGAFIGGVAGGLIASYGIAGPVGVASWAVPTTIIAISAMLD